MSDKLEDKELKKLQELHSKIVTSQRNIGILEINKEEELKIHKDFFHKYTVYGNELQIKYGRVSFDIATGNITEIKDDGKEKTS